MSISALSEPSDERKKQARAKVEQALFAKTKEAKAIQQRVQDLWRLNQLLSHPGSVQGEAPADTKKMTHERRKLLDTLGYETYEPDTAIEPMRQGLLVEVFNKARFVSDRYDMLAATPACRIGQNIGIRLEDGRFDPNWKITGIRPDGVLELESADPDLDPRRMPVENILETMRGRTI